ncbi:unnamed protein product [Arctia plantaginis]|uniref:Serendipity locus protein alpha n=1 Tax=Arctia plantaginis TaxID=874455 RepID=A0A8S1AX32_ARCPL|nr:unnamed protein product [Arctia plantaginis]
MEGIEESFQELNCIPQDTRGATKHLLSLILDKIHPLILGLHNKLLSFESNGEEVLRLKEVYTLCSNQINKCLINLFEVLKLEAQERIHLQESRQCSLERLSWCIKRLLSIETYLDWKTEHTEHNDSANKSMNVSTMHFVNWIDHTFQVLGKLSDTVYQTDFKDAKQFTHEWKNEMVEYVTELHVSIDELLLSAMTLCRYCINDDQHIVKARCQVVLRETKALLGELIEGDLSSSIKATPDALKWPLMPSNVNVLIDVLKDVLYSLETNTNTALLALVVHCFSYSKPAIHILKEHFSNESKKPCSCLIKSKDDVTENCSFVKDFDLYNERLLQVGNFAVSCSSDQHRILTLRSGLASLEALDPHLVPALMMSAYSHHAKLLINSWTQEVQEIRDSIYLIVDPTAFAEKSKQMMHHKLLTILKENIYKNTDVCAVINIGCMVLDFFLVYDKCEPDALSHHDKLMVLVADLDKVQKECKIVSNLLSSNDDFIYEVKMPTNKKEVSMDQLTKRLKLLYTLINRIHILLCPKDNDDQLLEYEVGEEEQHQAFKNATHTVLKNFETYVNSPRKATNNMSRSIFGRTNVRSSTKNIPLSKLTKRFKAKMNTELSFSVQLDCLFNESRETNVTSEVALQIKNLDKLRENSLSVLYNFSPIKRPSLRKAVLNRQYKIPTMTNETIDKNVTYDNEAQMDATMSLQITGMSTFKSFIP